MKRWINLALMLAMLPAPVLGTIRNEDLCHSGLCLKIYDNSKAPVSDYLVYVNADGAIMYVVRFNENRDLLVVNLSPSKGRNCERNKVSTRRHSASVCFDVAINASRAVSARYFSSEGGGFVRKINPTIWIDCERSRQKCDSKSAAPIRLEGFLLNGS